MRMKLSESTKTKDILVVEILRQIITAVVQKTGHLTAFRCLHHFDDALRCQRTVTRVSVSEKSLESLAFDLEL